MLKRINKKEVYSLIKNRNKNSHKGDNGHLLIVGGSIDYHGAPILAGIGALRSGVDLVTIFVPEVNFEISRAMYPDFIVKKYPGEHLTERYVDKILNYSKKCSAILIGPGIKDNEKSMEACFEIIMKTSLPIVLDASAISVLKKVEKFPLAQSIVITPHKNEFRNLVDRDMDIDENDPKSIVFLRSIAMDLNINILLKGNPDYVVSEDGDVVLNETGNAGMTVGGTGDFLAGVVASLLAQKYDSYLAIQISSYMVGKAGDMAYKKYGYGLMASDLGEELAKSIQNKSFFGLL